MDTSRANSPETQPSEWQDVQRCELQQITGRRKHAWLGAKQQEAGDEAGADSEASSTPSDANTAAASSRNLVGLSFSGGGIRSATFALGVLQGLAEFRLLRLVDYLSLVSGGSYIGGWFTAWVKREGSMENVRLQLDPSRVEQARAVRRTEQGLLPQLKRIRNDGSVDEADSIFEAEPEPIRHLRSYSNYLAPRLGLLSADTWTLVALYLRNLLAIQLLLVSSVTILVGGLRALLYGHAIRREQLALQSLDGSFWQSLNVWSCLDGILGLIVLGVALVTLAYFLVGLILTTYRTGRGHRWNWPVVGPVVLTVIGLYLVSPYLFQIPFLDSWFQNAGKDRLSIVSSSAFTMTVVPAAALVFASFLMKLMVIVFFGRSRHEHAREWFGRCGGWVLILACGWLTVAGIALYGPMLLMWATDGVRYALAAGWLGASLMGVLAGYSNRTGSKGGSYWMELATRVGPPVFIVGLLCFVSWSVSQLIDDEVPAFRREALLRQAQSVSDYGNTPISITESGSVRGPAFQRLDGTAEPVPVSDEGEIRSERTIEQSTNRLKLAALTHSERLQAMRCDLLYVLLVCSVGTLLLSLAVIDINGVSLNSVYANRLIRCYLGASRRRQQADQMPLNALRKERGVPCGSHEVRREHWFTGFDPQDDEPLENLKIGGEYWGPYPLINTALNLVAGEELAWQERMADSFTISPAYSGNPSLGFRRMDWRNGKKKPWGGLTLGRAMAISGAAASPNMGYHTTSSVAALLTAFNVRIGWWMGNPKAPKAWQKSGPRLGLGPLLMELTAQTNAKREFVYLSDGGHFENLGVYELVRRRCRYIIASDAGADPNSDFQDLGGLIRKCRTDFGIDIEIDTSQLRPDPESGLSNCRCAIGTIRYDRVDPASPLGILVYLKPTVTGDEPADIQNYRAKHASFPHQPTADQFFSESQFESYRALGLHTIRSVFASVMGAVDKERESWCRQLLRGSATNADKGVERSHSCMAQVLFEGLRRHWLAPPPRDNQDFLDSITGYMDIQEVLRSDQTMGDVTMKLYPEFWPGEVDPSTSRTISPTRLNVAAKMVQVMENTWLGLKLDTYYGHPLNRGWMSVCHRWAASPDVQQIWPIIRGEFSRRFVEFCESELPLSVRYDWKTISYDQAAHDPDFAKLRTAFGCEWGSPATVTNAFPFADRLHDDRIRIFSVCGGADSEPRQHACGCIALLNDFLPSTPDESQVRELFMWVMPTQRNLGIGRFMLAQFLNELIVGQAAKSGGDAEAFPNILLRVRYPRPIRDSDRCGANSEGEQHGNLGDQSKLTRSGAGERIARRMWVSFFDSFGFRRRDRFEAWEVRQTHISRTRIPHAWLNFSLSSSTGQPVSSPPDANEPTRPDPAHD